MNWFMFIAVFVLGCAPADNKGGCTDAYSYPGDSKTAGLCFSNTLGVPTGATQIGFAVIGPDPTINGSKTYVDVTIPLSGNEQAGQTYTFTKVSLAGFPSLFTMGTVNYNPLPNTYNCTVDDTSNTDSNAYVQVTYSRIHPSESFNDQPDGTDYHGTVKVLSTCSFQPTVGGAITNLGDVGALVINF